MFVLTTLYNYFKIKTISIIYIADTDMRPFSVSVIEILNLHEKLKKLATFLLNFRFPEHVVSYIVVTLYFVSLRFWVNIMTNINEYVEVYP